MKVVEIGGVLFDLVNDKFYYGWNYEVVIDFVFFNI